MSESGSILMAIDNSDQGCQFTSNDWVDYLNEWGIQISMTGKGRCLDNIYIERFWRSFKREKFYLNEYNTVKDLRYAIEEYVEFYNQRRWHQSLNYETPAEVYFKQEREACGYVDASFGPASECGQAVVNAGFMRCPWLVHTSRRALAGPTDASTYPHASRSRSK